MTESYYVQHNLARLERFEQEITQTGAKDPNRMVQIYAELSDDLAFAQTQFPKAEVTKYLNQLLAHLHKIIHVNKTSNWDKVKQFWLYTVPSTSFNHRSKLFYSIFIFILSVAIGAFSAANDQNFARLILSDGYVNMTETNIEKGDPLAVYKGNAEQMFAYITLNNIRVSFLAFAAGLLWSVGTVYLLISNGIMLGAFHHIFYRHDLLLDSILTVWIHGSLEISAIVIAGAAGFILGHGMLYPGTYGRLRSIQKAAKEGAQLVAGLVPIFIMAGFLESYVTRLTESPTWFKLVIISASFGWIAFYFFIYPNQLHKNGRLPKN